MGEFSQYIGRSIHELPSPSVVVDMPRLRHNIARMADAIGGFGVALRPHWKTSKCIEVARLQLVAGAVGLTAATANEVQALIDGGVADIFWAYPPVGGHRIAQVIVASRRAKITVSGDSIESLAPLSDAASDAGASIAFRLDVDTGLGRTGVAPEQAVDLAHALSALPGLRFAGVYTHEGQVQGVGADPEKRTAAGLAAGRLLVDVADAIRASGIEVVEVSVGSTAGAMSAPSITGITEARPGTYVYGDENQVAIGTASDEDCAVSVVSRVISMQREDVVLMDAGIKAMSSDGSLHRDGRIGTVVSDRGYVDGGILITGHEEHGFLRTSSCLAVGELVRIRPNHACGLSNMHSHVFATESGVVTDVWPIVGRH